MGYIYIGIGGLLILWGSFPLKMAFRPIRVRPFLLILLGVLMIYTGWNQWMQ